MPKIEDGCYGSLKGVALIAKVLAGRCRMHYTRVAAGKGTISEDLTPKTLTEPPEYVMDAMISSVTNPVDGECQVSVQINSAHVENGFYCTWLILYAEDPDEGEVPFTTLCLENEPEWIRPASSIVGKLAHFDIVAAVGDVDKVSATIDPDALVTRKELDELLNGIGTDRLDITIPNSGWVPDADTGGAYALHVDLANMKITERMIPYLSVTPVSLGAAVACNMCPAARTLDGLLRVYAGAMPAAPIRASLTLVDTSWQTSGAISGTAAQLREDITIPVSGWERDGETGCLRLDIPWPEATDEQIPMLTVLPDSLDVAAVCGFRQLCRTLEGAVRVYTDTAPAAPITASLALMGLSPYAYGGGTALAGGSMPVATREQAGVVKPGTGLAISRDGTLSVDTASEAEVNEMLTGEFPDSK